MSQSVIATVSDVETWRALWCQLLAKMREDKLTDDEIQALVDTWLADLDPEVKDDD
jgi:hypothetical protein